MMLYALCKNISDNDTNDQRTTTLIDLHRTGSQSTDQSVSAMSTSIDSAAPTTSGESYVSHQFYYLTTMEHGRHCNKPVIQPYTAHRMIINKHYFCHFHYMRNQIL